MDERHLRTEALVGPRALSSLRRSHALVVGVGGVGSWCAEALARTGIGRLTLMDGDTVAVSNLNRQSPATSRTIGRVKVEVLRERLLEIDPSLEIQAVFDRYVGGDLCKGGSFPDVVVDAIDSVADKAELILAATAAGIPIVSSMGAALRTDPTCVTVARFEKVSGDGLAKALRQRFRRLGRFPTARFDCVYSTERPVPCSERGSVMPVTAAFGMALAATAMRLVIRSSSATSQEL